MQIRKLSKFTMKKQSSTFEFFIKISLRSIILVNTLTNESINSYSYTIFVVFYFVFK